MRTARGRYTIELEEKRKTGEALQEKLEMQKKTLQSKQKTKELLQKAERQSFLAHAAKRERIRKLSELAAKIAAKRAKAIASMK
jgi:hypothetical protein